MAGRVSNDLDQMADAGCIGIKFGLDSADTKVLSATHKPLSEMVAKGEFREDLYYRINVINIELPGLRERPSDIPYLAQHFLSQVCEDVDRNIDGFFRVAGGDAVVGMTLRALTGRHLERDVRLAVQRDLAGTPRSV